MRTSVEILVAVALTAGGATSLASQETTDAVRPAESAGPVVEVDGWWAAPRNLDVDYAFVDTSGSLSGGGRVQTLGHGREPVTRLFVGWKLATPGEPVWGARLWELDAATTSSTGAFPQQVGALLASPDFAIGRSLVDEAAAESRLRTTVVDGGVRWHGGGGERAWLGYELGLRVFRFEENVVVTYRATSTGPVLEQFVTRSSEARGIGPRGAVSFGYRLGRRTTLGAGLGLAAPIGDLESLTTDTALIDGAFDRATVVERPEQRLAFVQLELSLQLEVRLGAGWLLLAAYDFQTWSDVRSQLRFIDDVSQNTAIFGQADAAFEGARLGARYSF
jgi:hypothetical protein